LGRLALRRVSAACVLLTLLQGLRGVTCLPPEGLRHWQRTLTLCCGGSRAMVATLRTFTRIWSFL
jgi:hypothetical protein